MVLAGAVNAGTIAAKIRLDSTLEADSRKARASLKTVTGALAGVTVAAGAAALALSATIGKQVIATGSDVEEMMGKFDAVFRENAESVEEWADSFGDDVGRSKFELMGFASTLQDTFVPMGFARDEGAELSKQLTELAIDLASFNNEAEPETIASLQSALVGNHETMRKYGVIITQTTLSQELMNMGIADGVKSATEQQKVQARMNIIMEGTTDAQGDAARTAGSLANMQRRLKSTMSEMMGEAGRDELPEMTKVLEDFDAWGKAGGYEDVQGFFSDVAAATTIAAKGMSEFTKQVTFIYSFYSDKFDDIQEDLAASRAETAKAILESNENISDDLRAKLEVNLGLNATWEDSILDIEGAQRRLASTSGTTTDDIIEDVKAVQAAFDDTEIPGWAGQTEYIKSQLAAAGIKPGDVGPEGEALYNIASIWTRELGDIIPGMETVPVAPTVPAPTVFAGAPAMPTVAAGADTSAVSMLMSIDAGIAEGNRLAEGIIGAVHNIQITAGIGGGFGARGGIRPLTADPDEVRTQSKSKAWRDLAQIVPGRL